MKYLSVEDIISSPTSTADTITVNVTAETVVVNTTAETVAVNTTSGKMCFPMLRRQYCNILQLIR